MWRVVLVLVLVLALAPPASASHSGCPDSTDPRVEEWVFDSLALGRTTMVCVLLPDGYDAGTPQRYPVLFLLHGVGDYEGDWLEETDIETLTHDLGLIVVMPDGGGHNGDAGWYSDWVDGPAWESFHIGELVPAVDARYATLGSREARAIAGNSMGGFGAMSYGARHPDLFVAAASFSGAVDITFGGPAQAFAFEMGGEHGLGTPGDDVWGPYESDEVRWRDHNPPDLSRNLGSTDVWLATGNGVTMPGDSPADAPIESGVYTLNQWFHSDLTLEGADHAWYDRGHGTHQWHYWEADLATYLSYLDELFDDPPAPSGSFDFRTVRNPFTVWDWSFAVARDVMEFLDLRDVSERGLVVTGSGQVSVTSAAAYVPGDVYVLGRATRTSGGGHVHVERIAAGSDGRLRFGIDLGPAHDEQQYTPEARVDEAADRDHWRTVTVSIHTVK